MNIILEGIIGAGKSYLADKLAKKYNLTNKIYSTAKTRNDVSYFIDLLDTCENTVFERFHISEIVFSKIYNREDKISEEDFRTINRRVFDNNDLIIIFTSSDHKLIVDRLIERNENTELEIDKQIELFNEHSKLLSNYKNCYIVDVADSDAYNKLDLWIEEHFGKVTTNVAYKKVCKDLIEKGHIMETRNVRGGTKELCNYLFTIDDLDTEYVSLETGKSDLTYLAAEILWYWSARNDTAFIGHFAKLWGMLSDDGITNNSAYGYILQKKHGFNQIEKVIELLTVDPYSRRAVININVPNEKVIETKDEPCTIALTYQIRNKKLHCTAVMRSNDIRFGLRNDLGYFIALQKYIAKRLGIEAGSYTHFAESIHFYSVDAGFTKDVATGTMARSSESLDITKLIECKDELISWVDNLFTSKEDFKKLLLDLGVIYKGAN